MCRHWFADREARVAQGVWMIAVAMIGVLTTTAPRAMGPVERLKPTGGLPAHICGKFEEPIGFARSSSGKYFVLDRRAHTVYSIDAAGTSATRLLQVGSEGGRVLQPGVLSLGPDGVFAVADGPASRERVQYFSEDGTALGGFFLPGRSAQRLTMGPLVLNGVGSMQFTGQMFLINAPEADGLITELDVQGRPVRHMGALRRTDQEADRDVHLALNIGLPLVDPTGGFFFVFQTGVPMFRKYAADGRLVFERHIEGVEIDGQIQTLPSSWPRRKTGDGTLPIVEPLVRTAAVDRSGRLWVSLMVPFTYVYDARGDKARVIQFEAAGTIAPTSLSFAPNGQLLVTPGCYTF